MVKVSLDVNDAVSWEDAGRECCAEAGRNMGTFYVRKPKKAKPPVRPDEPPVGSFFRVDRTGFEFWRFASMEDGYGYWQISPRSEEPDWERWDDITEPGDTITRLYLREVPND
jgi:hypothetical protein